MPRVTDVEGRREQILRAAVTVFSERGYASATISDIANEAGVAHGTVYLYFRSKAEIFRYLVRVFFERLIADVTGAGEATEKAGDLAADLYRMIHGALEDCARYPRLAAVCMREAITEGTDTITAIHELDRVLVLHITSRIARAVESGELRTLSPEFVGFLVARLLGTAIQWCIEKEGEVSVDRVAKDLVDFIMFGLVSDKLRNNPPSAFVLPSVSNVAHAVASEISSNKGDEREDRS